MKVTVKLAFFRDETDSKIYNTSRNLIEWWTNSKYYHVEIIIGNVWISSDDNGVHVAKLRPLKTDYDYVDIDVNITEEQYRNVIHWCSSKKGSKYDYLGIILSTVIPARVDNPNKWFCSEIVTKILQLMLVRETYDLTPNMVTPGDLSRLFGLEK